MLTTFGVNRIVYFVLLARLAKKKQKIIKKAVVATKSCLKQKCLNLSGPFWNSILWYPDCGKAYRGKGQSGHKRNGKKRRQKSGGGRRGGFVPPPPLPPPRPPTPICSSISQSCKARRSHTPQTPSFSYFLPHENIDSTCLTIRIDFRLSVLANSLLFAPVHSCWERNINTVSQLSSSPSHILCHLFFTFSLFFSLLFSLFFGPTTRSCTLYWPILDRTKKKAALLLTYIFSSFVVVVAVIHILFFPFSGSYTGLIAIDPLNRVQPESCLGFYASMHKQLGN